MHALTGEEILQAWEAGLGQHPLDRALTLLELGCAGEARAELARLSLGRRDALLLELRERTFGARLAAFAECRDCATRLELVTTTHALRAPAPETASEFPVELDGLSLRLRLLDSRDQAAIVGAVDRESARRELLARCVLEARRGGERIDARELSAAEAERVGEELLAADPQAEVRLALSCPQCGLEWRAPFSSGEFLFGEVTAEAHRLLRQVHLLASAYGWPETDILRMPPARRQLYAELASS